MSIRVDYDGRILLEGDCSLEDVEPLLRGLLEAPGAELDWRGCHHVHAAILQLMLASQRAVIGPPGDPFLETCIGPLLRRPGD